MKREKNLRYLINILLICAILISIIGFYKDYKNTITFGTVDFRSRVVGARLILEKKDPYFYKWKEGDSELLLQPTENINSPISNITVPPTVLTFYASIAKLPYKVQKIIWFFAQWFLLIGSIFLLSKSTNSWIKTKLIWIFGLVFISGSSFWRLHVERGQVYILYIFLISLAYWIYTRNFKNNQILSGFFIGLTVSLRPTYIIMCLPMLIYKKFKVLIGAAAGIIIGIATSFIFVNFSIWKSYFSLTSIYGKIYMGEIQLPAYESISNRTIEGVSNLNSMANIPAVDASVVNILKENLHLNLNVTYLLISIILILIISSILMLIFRYGNDNPKFVFLLGLVITSTCDFFLPAHKFSYGNVIWLLIIALLIDYSEPLSRILNPILPILFIGLFFIISIPFAPRDMLFPEVLISIYFVIVTLFFMIQNWISNRKKLE